MVSWEELGNSDTWLDFASSSSLINLLFPDIRASLSGVLPHLQITENPELI